MSTNTLTFGSSSSILIEDVSSSLDEANNWSIDSLSFSDLFFERLLTVVFWWFGEWVELPTLRRGLVELGNLVTKRSLGERGVLDTSHCIDSA